MGELFLKTLNMSIAASWLILAVVLLRFAQHRRKLADFGGGAAPVRAEKSTEMDCRPFVGRCRCAAGGSLLL